MSLADQIIEHGPLTDGELAMLPLFQGGAKDFNGLRDELIEGRRLRAAAEARARYEVTGVGYDFHEVELWCRCGWNVEVEPSTGLAELVRRADEHSEGCA